MIAIDSGIKHVGILLYAYIVYCIAMPEKQSRYKYLTGGLEAILIGGTMAFIKGFIYIFGMPALIAAFFLTEGVHFRLNPRKNLTLTLISFGVSYGTFYLSVAASTLFMAALSYCTASRFGSPEKAMDYYSALVRDGSARQILAMTALSLLQGIFVCLMLRSRRLRNGLSTLVRFGMSDVGVYISIATLSVMMMYAVSVNTGMSNTVVLTVCFFLGITFVFMLYYWIKNEIRSAYKSRIKENELLLLEKSISEKDKLIEMLRKDNEKMAGIIHKDNKLIPAMVMSVKKCAAEMQNGRCDTSDALETAEALESIYGERSAALSEYESHGGRIAETGITAVDAVLLYMGGRAESCGVKFNVNVETDVSRILDEAIDRREFDTMLADLAENAIISARQQPSGIVSVNIKKSEGSYCLEVLDNGEPFSSDALKNIGVRKFTTHKEEGGSGTGLMTLFRIIRRNNASLTIEEYPEGNPYSKAVRVTFNGKGCKKIVTGRADELKKSLRAGRFEIAASAGAPDEEKAE